jgi:hypothetical protein
MHSFILPFVHAVIHLSRYKHATQKGSMKMLVLYCIQMCVSASRWTTLYNCNFLSEYIAHSMLCNTDWSKPLERELHCNTMRTWDATFLCFRAGRQNINWAVTTLFMVTNVQLYFGLAYFVMFRNSLLMIGQQIRIRKLFLVYVVIRTTIDLCDTKTWNVAFCLCGAC